MFFKLEPRRSRWLRFHLWHWSLSVSDSRTFYTKAAGVAQRQSWGLGGCGKDKCREQNGAVERGINRSGDPRTACSHCGMHNAVNFKDTGHFYPQFFSEWITYWTARKTMLTVFTMKFVGHIPQRNYSVQSEPRFASLSRLTRYDFILLHCNLWACRMVVIRNWISSSSTNDNSKSFLWRFFFF